MTLHDVSMLIHYIGIGLIFTTLFGGWILNRQYLKAKAIAEKSQVLKVMRPFGLLSPINIAIMVLSGIGNMTIERSYTLFSDSWLSTKLVFFLIAAGVGMAFGARSRKRAGLVLQMAQSNAPEGAEATVAALDRQHRAFYIFQTAMIIIILLLSIVRPA